MHADIVNLNSDKKTPLYFHIQTHGIGCRFWLGRDIKIRIDYQRYLWYLSHEESCSVFRVPAPPTMSDSRNEASISNKPIKKPSGAIDPTVAEPREGTNHALERRSF